MAIRTQVSLWVGYPVSTYLILFVEVQGGVSISIAAVGGTI